MPGACRRVQPRTGILMMVPNSSRCWRWPLRSALSFACQHFVMRTPRYHKGGQMCATHMEDFEGATARRGIPVTPCPDDICMYVAHQRLIRNHSWTWAHDSCRQQTAVRANEGWTKHMGPGRVVCCMGQTAKLTHSPGRFRCRGSHPLPWSGPGGQCHLPAAPDAAAARAAVVPAVLLSAQKA